MKQIKKILTQILLLAIALTSLAFALSGCSGNGLYTEGEGSLNVVCTSFPPFDIAREIGKDKITVTVLQDNGADLHNFSPTAKTLKALSEADVFICVGGESDKKWVDDAISSAGNTELKVIRLTDHVELTHAELEGHDHGEGAHENDKTDDGHEGDEHVWLSLRNVMTISDKICSVFAEKDPERAANYQSNTASFKEKLTALDAEYTKAVSEARTKTVVFADRFPFIYLTNDLGLCYYAAFSGCSTEINADFSTQVKLINAVKEYSLPAVIVTEGGNKELADNICAETGCKKVILNSMQSVTRAEIQNGISYLDIMNSNLSALKEALG